MQPRWCSAQAKYLILKLSVDDSQSNVYSIMLTI